MERLAGEKAYEFCMDTSTAWPLQIGPQALFRFMNDRAFGKPRSDQAAGTVDMSTAGQVCRGCSVQLQNAAFADASSKGDTSRAVSPHM